MLYDILTVALLIGGCLLLWLNLRPHRRDVLRTPREPFDQEGQARVSEQLAVPLRTELRAEHRTIFAVASPPQEPFSELAASNQPDPSPGQNSYADRVATAMARLKKPNT